MLLLYSYLFLGEIYGLLLIAFDLALCLCLTIENYIFQLCNCKLDKRMFQEFYNIVGVLGT
jgi:hypothetical protein